MNLEAYGDWRKAAEMLAVAAGKSRFVAKQVDRSNLSIGDVTASPEGFRQLIALRKDDFLEDQRTNPPFGTRLVTPLSEVGLIVESSGSSGRGPETHCLTRRDAERLAALWADHLAALGISADDIVALTFPIGMAGGGVKHAAAYVHLGAKTLRIASLKARQKLETMRYYGATVLVATPSYVDRLAVAAEEAGIEPAALGVKRLVVATQSVSADWVRRTEAMWGARLYEWYGTSAGLVAFSCSRGMVDAAGRGTLHWVGGSALSEVVDLENGDLVPDGARGEIVGTPLINEAEPFFRYATGDEVRFIAGGSCSCGSSLPGVESGTVRRLDQMFKVKGVNLWASAVEEELFSLAPVQDYRARLGHDDARHEVVRIEVLAPDGDESLASRIGTILRDTTGIRFEVAVTRRSSEWSHETTGEAAKARRWVDERTL